MNARCPIPDRTRRTYHKRHHVRESVSCRWASTEAGAASSTLGWCQAPMNQNVPLAPTPSIRIALLAPLCSLLCGPAVGLCVGSREADPEAQLLVGRVAPGASPHRGSRRRGKRRRSGCCRVERQAGKGCPRLRPPRLLSARARSRALGRPRRPRRHGYVPCLLPVCRKLVPIVFARAVTRSHGLGVT